MRWSLHRAQRLSKPYFLLLSFGILRKQYKTKMGMRRKFIEVDGVLVNPEVHTKNFCCDLSKCKGACCTIESEYGAPLTEAEVKSITELLPEISSYMKKSSLEYIEKEGFCEEKEGELLTKSIDNKDCVFVYYEGDVAKCAMEKAYFDGKISFRKPVSCHLFPIRVSSFGGPVLRYEEYPVCDCAVSLGKKQNGPLIVDFCSDALKRLFGEDWFLKLKKILGGE